MSKITLLQSIVMEAYKGQVQTKEPIHDPKPATRSESSYTEELMEIG